MAIQTPQPTIDRNSIEGVNVEDSSVLSKEARDTIQKNQEATKKELKEADASSSVSLSSQLSEIKLSDLKISPSGVPKGIALSGLSTKDMINTSKVDLSKDDLSKIKKSHLNLKLLLAMGFSVIAVIGIAIILLKRIKAINKKTKRKRKSLIAKLNNVPYDPTKDSEIDNDDIEFENEIDKLEDEKKNLLIDSINANKSVLAELPVTTDDDVIEALISKISDEENELNDLISNSLSNLSTNNPPNTTGGDTSNYNKLDQYSKKRKDVKRKSSNSPYTVDQRQRNDIMNSNKAVSNKKRTVLYKNNPNYGKYYSF